LDPNLDLKQLVHHSTVQYVDSDVDGDVDVYDEPGKKTPDENPMSAPVGAEVASRKLIAKQKGELKHTKRGVAYEETSSGDEGLRDWFGKSKSSDGKPGWVQLVVKWAGKPCASHEPGEGLLLQSVAVPKWQQTYHPKKRKDLASRKNRQDPNQPEKTGGAKPT
jgi:hypothetical protein